MSDIQTPRQVLEKYLGGVEVTDFTGAVVERLIDINYRPTKKVRLLIHFWMNYLEC